MLFVNCDCMSELNLRVALICLRVRVTVGCVGGWLFSLVAVVNS